MRTLALRLMLTAAAGIAALCGTQALVASAPAHDATPRPVGELVLTVYAGPGWLEPLAAAHSETLAVGPQMALWLENAEGGFIATIFITHASATEDWGERPPGETGIRRPEALPVWFHKHRGVGLEKMSLCGACHRKRKSPDKETRGDPELEAITRATPTARFTWTWPCPDRLSPGSYVVRAEVNHWGDPGGGSAPDESGNGNGSWVAGADQPSLVWKGTIEVGAAEQTSRLVPVGHGHPSGATGDVYEDLHGLTTALSIVDSIRVVYVPAG